MTPVEQEALAQHAAARGITLSRLLREQLGGLLGHEPPSDPRRIFYSYCSLVEEGKEEFERLLAPVAKYVVDPELPVREDGYVLRPAPVDLSSQDEAIARKYQGMTGMPIGTAKRLVREKAIRMEDGAEWRGEAVTEAQLRLVRPQPASV